MNDFRPRVDGERERPLPDGVALSIEMLPAAFGDCLVVRAATDDGEFRMVVDTGPDDASLGALRRRLAAVPRIGSRRHVDLLVVTHIDHDHIGNTAELLRDEMLGLEFGDVWFNGAEQVRAYASSDPRDPARSVLEGEEVSSVLVERGIRHNKAFGGRAVVVGGGAGPPWLDVPMSSGHPRLALLSPRSDGLRRLAKVWRDALARLASAQPDSPNLDVTRRPVLDRLPIDLAALADTRSAPDRSIPNRSSIVLFLEHRGASLLLAADGHFEVYGPALAALVDARGTNPPKIDAVKLAHHGSRGNTTTQLALFGASHYLVSSDNAVYGLPDDETIARLVVRARQGREPTIWFNYATPLNLRWAEVARACGRFSARYPERPGAGIVLDLLGSEQDAEMSDAGSDDVAGRSD